MHASNLDLHSTQEMLLVKEEARKLLGQLSSTGKANDLSRRDRERYEKTKVDIRDGSLRPLMEIGENWFKQGQYAYLDGEVIAQEEYKKAMGEMFTYQTWIYYPDVEKQREHFHDEMKKKFDELIREAQQPGASETRAALAYVLLSHGRPFRSEEEREEAMQLAAGGILEICKNKTEGAREMASIVASSMITDSTLSTKVRKTLYYAMKEMVDDRKVNSAGMLSSTNMGPIIISALKAEHKSMPAQYLQNYTRQWLNPDFKEAKIYKLKCLIISNI